MIMTKKVEKLHLEALKLKSFSTSEKDLRGGHGATYHNNCTGSVDNGIC